MKTTITKYLSNFFLLIFLISGNAFCQKKYEVQYILSGKDTLYKIQQFNLKTIFETKSAAQLYISKLPGTILSKGFLGVSVDSAFYDSLFAKVKIFLGEKYKWIELSADSVDPGVLDYIGWNEKQFDHKIIDFTRLRADQEKIIEYYEDSGFPFVEVSLKNIEINNDSIKAQLNVKKGPLYHIDSIRVYGKVKIKNLFLQHYLGIYNGSVYDVQKLKEVSKLLKDLPFLQEQQSWDVTMYGTGSTLNLYLQSKRSSQINALVGFEPGNTITGKALVTADVHLDLKNTLGNGEGILVNWQQLQAQSPRLNLGYTHPYIYNSNFGFDFSFDLLKSDSTYLQLNGILGLDYIISPSKTLKIFYQNQQSYLLSGGIDTLQIIATKTLPSYIDVGSGNLGIGYHFINTNYRLNPRKGNELDITATGGIKKTEKNSEIVNLKDPSDSAFNFNSLYDSIKLKTYQFKIIASGAHYFPIGKSSTFKTALSVGIIESPQTFQNELFRIGGYQLLRGFDEESIYANRYEVFTAEYRYLVGINSYFFGFSDVGFTKTKFLDTDYSNSFISGGIGLAFETKFGLLNLNYAVGKRNGVSFNLRSASKISFGYINYF